MRRWKIKILILFFVFWKELSVAVILPVRIPSNSFWARRTVQNKILHFAMQRFSSFLPSSRKPFFSLAKQQCEIHGRHEKSFQKYRKSQYFIFPHGESSNLPMKSTCAKGHRHPSKKKFPRSIKTKSPVFHLLTTGLLLESEEPWESLQLSQRAWTNVYVSSESKF